MVKFQPTAVDVKSSREDDKFFFCLSHRKKLSRVAYGLFTASIIHTVINIIIYDCYLRYIAIFVDILFEKVEKINL